MISTLTGVLASKSPTDITVDVNGVGYAVSIPLSTFQTLGDVNSRVTVYTHLHVREDAMQLYGFASAADRDFFRLLISVSGVGPKIAQALLSGMTAADVKAFIAAGQAAPLTSIPGVGRKTAERLVLELREKLQKSGGDAGVASDPGPTPSAVRNETLLALTSLGYARPAAERAIRAALADDAGRAQTVEELIRRALKHLSASS
jgi:Holliday junction DNA helicase RuvA